MHREGRRDAPRTSAESMRLGRGLRESHGAGPETLASRALGCKGDQPETYDAKDGFQTRDYFKGGDVRCSSLTRSRQRPRLTLTAPPPGREPRQARVTPGTMGLPPAGQSSLGPPFPCLSTLNWGAPRAGTRTHQHLNITLHSGPPQTTMYKRKLRGPTWSHAPGPPS